MKYPVWQIQGGDLGKISSQVYYKLQFRATINGLDAGITLISGGVPQGLQFLPAKDTQSGVTYYYLQGIPSDLGQDVTSEFTLRAYGTGGSISDRKFNLTVTGNYLPNQILNQNLGNFLDCTRVDIAIQSVDFNPSDVLTYSLEGITDNNIRGSGMPEGLQITDQGRIQGIIQPLKTQVTPGSVSIGSGFGNTSWGYGTFSGTGNPQLKQSFSFTVKVTDGKTSTFRRYDMTVYNSIYIGASMDIPVDLLPLTTNLGDRRFPIMLTEDLSYDSRAQSGEYFSYKFTAVDFDQDILVYELCGSDNGWENTGWDTEFWESSDYGLPPGIYLDDQTGWLAGKIQAQAETEITYTFGVRAYKLNYPQYTTACGLYTLTVLGPVSNEITWISDTDLGTMYSGSPSQLKVEAVAKNGRPLYYKLKYDSNMVNGCQLLQTGEIVGKPTFQHFYLDHGTTTIDSINLKKHKQSDATSIDRQFTITVIATDFNQTVYSEHEFTFKVFSNSYSPYENLYLVCRPPVDNRRQIISLLKNTDIFAAADVYRKPDPFFGNSTEFRILTAAGLSPSTAATYMAAMQTRHRDKTLYFRDFRCAKALDKSGNHMYDVIYVQMSQDTDVDYDTPPDRAAVDMRYKKTNWQNPRAADVPGNKLVAGQTSFTASWNRSLISSTYYSLIGNNTFYINDQVLMTDDIIAVTGVADQNVLPAWMSSIQSDGRVPGFQLAVVLAYMKPGTGDKTLFNLRRYIGYDIKLIPFQVDRYVLDNNLSQNFDLDNQVWNTPGYTSFDDGSRAASSITPDHVVDYAVDTPFLTINNAILSDILDAGGLDGMEENYLDKTLIFYTQEKYQGLENLPYDGWTYEDGSVVPGYYELINGQSITNLRPGIWKISYIAQNQAGWDPDGKAWDEISYDKYNTILSNYLVKLTFVAPVGYDQVVYVRRGIKHGNSYVQYTTSQHLSLGLSYPYYRTLKESQAIAAPSTTFDGMNTQFLNNADPYRLPLEGDKYLKFPQQEIFQQP